MKISEILNEAPLPPVSAEDEDMYLDIHKKGQYTADVDTLTPDDLSGHKMLGAGYEATVVHKPGDPTVTKVFGASENIEKCAYMQYIFMCQKSANHNPYLPRVESIQKFKDRVRTGRVKSHYLIKLEKLEPIENLNAKEKEIILRKTFGIDLKILSSDPATYLPIKKIIDRLKKLLQNIDKKPPSAVDPLLIDALHIIDKLLHTKVKRNIELDLHAGNIMFRRTPYGPQLVITDPVAGYVTVGG